MKGFRKKYKSSQTPSLKLRVNDKIRVKQVRLISPEGEQIGIVDTSEAMNKAKAYDLDLVEIAPQAKPPVCKITDFGKMRYEHSKKQKQQLKKKSQNIVKTVKLSPNIGENDLTRKIHDAQKFLDKGFKVNVTVEMRGRQNKHPQLAFNLAETVKSNLQADVFDKISKQGNRVTLGVSQSPNFEKKPETTETSEDGQETQGA